MSATTDPDGVFLSDDEFDVEENESAQPDGADAAEPADDADGVMTVEPSPSPAAEELEDDRRTVESVNWSTGAHLSGLIGLVGIPSFLGPLLVWMLKKDDPEVLIDAKEALNFNLSFLLYGAIAAVSILVVVGIVLLPVVLVAWFVLTVIASVQTAQGEDYQYPLTIRFIQ